MPSFNPFKAFFKASALAIMACALVFFASVFLGIVGIAIYAGISHAKVDFAASYRYVAAPAGLTAFVVAFIVGIVLEIRNARKAE